MYWAIYFKPADKNALQIFYYSTENISLYIYFEEVFASY